MKVIIHHDENDNQHFMKYASNLYAVNSNYSILEIAKKYLPLIQKAAKEAEYNFQIKLRGENHEISREDLEDKDIWIVLIGKKQKGTFFDAYYNINKHTLKPARKDKEVCKGNGISCYSEDDSTDAVNYIRCVTYLADQAYERGKLLIIYADISILNKTLRYPVLTYKILSSYLADRSGILIVKTIKDEKEILQPICRGFLTNIFVTEDSLKEIIKKIKPSLVKISNEFVPSERREFSKRNSSLYKDIFYRSIPLEQNIYVILNYGNYRPRDYYKRLGISSAALAEDYNVLYAAKKVFDENSEVLQSEITPQYQMPIVSYWMQDVHVIDKQKPYSLLEGNIAHKGKGVYIGIVGTEGVNYFNKALRSKEGKTRIACIWEQKEAEEGWYYFKDDINKVLESENPDKIIPFSEHAGIMTMMLGIAGGEDYENGYKGIAVEAEFLVAKVNTAPDSLQLIYGGMPCNEAVVMPDLLVGFAKLREFARSQGKPLVFCLPFNTNINAHDASFIPNDIVSYIGRQAGITVIAPAGEEADKMHHYSIKGKRNKLEVITIEVKKENQNVIGMVCQKVLTIQMITLYSPNGIKIEAVNLKEGGAVKLERNGMIYSSGMHVNFLNGIIETQFRIENPEVGEWKIEIKLDSKIDSFIDMWISQQELNYFVTLKPSDPLKTIGSTACIDVISVGAYDEESMVVIKDSGRGYSWNEQVRPRLVTQAKNITAPYRRDEWANLTGTLAAASILTGAAATIYSKFIDENIQPLPNTLATDSILLSTLKQFEGINYPNPTQGYGIFDRKSLPKLLSATIHL